MSKQTHEFKAEIQQVLDLVINSLYSKKEIFLRELISNASDAIDRARYLGLTDKDIVADAPEWRIDVVADKESKTLMIVDNGIGMNRQDLENNLGVIANSGTKAFAKTLSENKEADLPTLIGQFGVGFYAAFMVAKEVTVISLKRGSNESAVKWNSSGDGTYTIEDAAREMPGTTVTLQLPEDMEEYLDEWRINELVKHYSDFITYPIRFAESGEPPAEDKKAINTMQALWKRSKSEVTDEELNEFYTHLTHDHQPPFKSIQMAVEGMLEFKALLYLPAHAGFDMLMPGTKHGLSLYVRSVFIGSELEMLLPEYLRFVKGVVESSDLPLNVSRETLQDDAVIRKIKSNITNKVLATLTEIMKNDESGYLDFYRNFGRILKEGLHFDFENADKLKALLLFNSAKHGDGKMLSLQEYVNNMPEVQQNIWYLVADNLETARNSPHIEAILNQGQDVLLFVDAIDQWIIDGLREFEGKKLVAVDKGELELGSETEQAESRKKIDAASEEYNALLEFLKAELKDEVREVRLTTRLADSACCLVAEPHALNASMERLMKAMNQEVPKQLRTLELNPEHALIKRMSTMVAANPDDKKLADYAELLYSQALVAEGSTPKNPQKFIHLLAKLMVEA